MNGKVLVFSGFLALASLAGCSSSPRAVKTEVVNNADRTLKTPDWVLSSRVMGEEKGNLVYTYRINLDGSARPDACVAMARSQAVAEMLKYIKNAVTASGQVEDLNDTSDPSYSSLTAFLSQGTLSGAQTTDAYWEQTIEGDSSGFRPVKRLLCAVRVAVDKQILDKQMREAINGVPGGNPEIRKKLIQAQKNFIDNVGATTQPAGSTADQPAP